MDDTIKSPQEMRRRLQDIAVRDGRLEFPIEPDFVGYIVRSVLVTARLQGWSGEDTYTVLAWHLLQAAQRYGSAALEHVNMQPPPSMILHLGVMQQALEALEYHQAQTRPIDKTKAAIAALRAVIDMPPLGRNSEKPPCL